MPSGFGAGIFGLSPLGIAAAQASTKRFVQGIVSNVVTVNVYNTSDAASDLGGSATVVAFGVG